MRWVNPAHPGDTAKGWIGERYDEGAGLQYLNARYYDPELGMFIQPDWWEVSEAGVGTNRYSYSFNDPLNMVDSNGHKPTLEEAKAIANDVYHKDGSVRAGKNLPDHIKRMSHEEREAKYPGAIWEDERTGFRAGAYLNSVTKEVTVAYAGTEASSSADWSNNVEQGTTGDSPQYRQARALAALVSRVTDNRPNALSFVGHSLGGGLALEAVSSLDWSFTRINHHRTAVTFNPAGIASFPEEYFSDILAAAAGRNRNIDVHVVWGDPLSALNSAILGIGTPYGSLKGVY
jgi:RHS repeat-associated protein